MDLKGRQVLVIASQYQGVSKTIVTFLEERCGVDNTSQVENLDDAMRVLLNHRGITVVCFSEDMRHSKHDGLTSPQAPVQILSVRGRNPRQLLLFWFNPRKRGKLCRCKLN